MNALQIGGDMHVLIDTVVAQVDRTELRQRGTSFSVQGTQFGISNVLGGIGNGTITGTFTAPLPGAVRGGHSHVTSPTSAGLEHQVRHRAGRVPGRPAGACPPRAWPSS